MAAEHDPGEWKRLSEAYDRDWIAAYTTAFIEFAMSRGWTRQDAESWADDLADEALVASSPGKDCPQSLAHAHVLGCEAENN